MRLLFSTILAVILLACSETATSDEPSAASPTRTPTPRPGSVEVYQRIESLTDCRALQSEFDQADENGKRDRARGVSSAVSTTYMEAADKRMKELKC